MTDYQVYPDNVKTPLVLTADDGTPYVVDDHYDDDGHITLHLYRFEDRTLADIYVNEGLESDVDDEVKRRKRRAKPQRAELPPDEMVSVFRLLEYRGPRTWVEETVSRSIHGTRIVERGKMITGVTVNDFPRRV